MGGNHHVAVAFRDLRPVGDAGHGSTDSGLLSG